MPSLPIITFQNLHHIIEECKEYIPPAVYLSMSNVLDLAYDNDDDIVIPAICWMILQTRLGAKSIREIVDVFLSKVESTQSQQYNQYKEMTNVLFVRNEEAMG